MWWARMINMIVCATWYRVVVEENADTNKDETRTVIGGTWWRHRSNGALFFLFLRICHTRRVRERGGKEVTNSCFVCYAFVCGGFVVDSCGTVDNEKYNNKITGSPDVCPRWNPSLFRICLHLNLINCIVFPRMFRHTF